MKKDVTETNQQIWFAPNIALEYARESSLTPAEIAILHHAKDIIAGAMLLDIGIGAGRTTNFLLKACRDYIGIDYSQAMIDIATARFPEATLLQQDARDLSAFTDEHFDVVCFSYNGIDYVSHADRIKILNEIRRVLKPSGIFIFSSHNRDSRIHPAHHWKNLQPSIKPRLMARRLLAYVDGIINASKHRAQQIQTEDYAILNDQAHQYNMLTYYISAKKQTEQLRSAGFTVEGMWGMGGERLEKDDTYIDGYSIYYLAKPT